MTVLHQIDPIALHLGPLQVHWYGIMYLLGFGTAWWLGRVRVRAGRLPGVNEQAYGDLLFYAMLGVVLGGRLGYVFFYSFGDLLKDPLMLFRIWEGGMSFHGGELWGKYTQAGWGVVFPRAEQELAGLNLPQLQAQFATGALDRLARHPSQLYQAVLEGLVMFLALWWFSSRPRPRYAVSGLFALLYGCFRFLVEFVRVPDAQIGYLAFGWLTMGQVLSLPLIALGLFWLWWSRRQPTLEPQPLAAAK